MNMNSLKDSPGDKHLHEGVCPASEVTHQQDGASQSEGRDVCVFPRVKVCVSSLQDGVSDRECCGVMCKCSGHEGVRGSRGPLGPKVTGATHV